MNQLGNLAIICAQRHDVSLQILDGEAFVHVGRGQDKQALGARWNDNAKIEEIIYELNHGHYKDSGVRSAHEHAQTLRSIYKPGTSVILISMKDEPQMMDGLKGKVTGVDDAAQIHVNWQNGSSLALNLEVDKFVAYAGPTTEEYIRKKLCPEDGAVYWIKKDFISVAVDFDTLVKEAEEYLNHKSKLTYELAIVTQMPYQTEVFFNSYLNDHFLTDKELQEFRKKTDYCSGESREGYCPKCGNAIDAYGSFNAFDDVVEYPWKCRKCGAAGREHGLVIFDGHYIDRQPDTKE